VHGIALRVRGVPEDRMIRDLYLERIRRGLVKPDEIEFHKFSTLVQGLLRTDVDQSLIRQFEAEIEKMKAKQVVIG
jgi:adenylate cyclase